MSLDLSQFHQVFFEESFEGLDMMETALMELNPEAIDPETINTIFRSAHSIKGGAATFGLKVVAEFTHVLETLLDEIRAGLRRISQDDIDLFLQSVDCLRQLLTDLQQKVEPDSTISTELVKKFEAILAKPNDAADSGNSTSGKSASAADKSNKSSVSPEAVSQESLIKIKFIPGLDILRTGNEPLRIFRELKEVVEITVVSHTDGIPEFSEFDPENCYLSFDIYCHGPADKKRLTEAFEWVSEGSVVDFKTYSKSEKPGDHQAIDTEVRDENSPAIIVEFRPSCDILKTGNEPLKIFQDLCTHTPLTVLSDTSNLPDWSNIDPEKCYLSWRLTLPKAIPESQIHEVFEWVSDDSEIKIIRVEEFKHLSTVDREIGSETIADIAESIPIAIAQEAEHNGKQTTSSEERAAADENQKIQASTLLDGQNKSVQTPASGRESTSIRVDIDKVDALINMVGELVITQSMLGQLGKDFDINNLTKLLEGLNQLEQNTRELQESVMRIRMLPISVAFNRFPRMVRDLSRRLNKKIDLRLIGEQTELDKTVMEKIGDPLVHLVRNALDHGIEEPEVRVRSGKPETGLVTLIAYHQSGNVVIEISDDGKGLDREKLILKGIERGLITEREAQEMSDSQVYDLIFLPGFSTASVVSDVSGRGVGMDVVRRNIQALNGSVEIDSKLGKGSKITIRLPLTLAILDGQLVRVGHQIYIFPLVSIVESIEGSEMMVNKVASGCNVFQLRNEYVPVIRLYEIFNVNTENHSLDDALLVVVENEGEKIAILVDELLAQQQVVIKSLEQNYQRVEGVSGATILGDGRVALILDIPGLVKIAGINQKNLAKTIRLSQTVVQEHRLQ